MYYNDTNKKLLTTLIFQLQNIDSHSHNFGETHIPYHQHKRLSGIIYTVIRKIQAYQKFQLINILNIQFWELQECIYDMHQKKAGRMQYAIGAVNVKLMLYLKNIKNGKRDLIYHRKRNL